MQKHLLELIKCCIFATILNGEILSTLNKEELLQSTQSLHERPMIVVDLFSGSYIENETGHECKNLEPALDGRYYGYCPPLDNININNLGASDDEIIVNGVIVVYVRKDNNSSDRTIIAFTDNATIHRHRISDIIQLKKLGRVIEKNGNKEYPSYTIESDNLVRIGFPYPQFTIHISDYNTYMFRAQRFYKGTYPELDNLIINYIELCKNYIIDDTLYQTSIQEVAADEIDIENLGSSTTAPEYTSGIGSTQVKKNPKKAKSILQQSGYKCAFNSSHRTFTTNLGTIYMEGHHLIPCTLANSELFWDKYSYNVDSLSNIVCICPTCHRRIHYGNADEKREILTTLYNRQIPLYLKDGLNISLDDLLKLYNL